ncbi:MAG: pseudouridine-5'-phosphate glycosidase [Candidatus Sericytochromatia bacterium]
MTPTPPLVLHPDVRAALAEGRPVVALESTIITHGMPYPANVETALAVEAVIREGGAVPATIAIVDGKMRVGLTQPEIEALARAEHVVKCSRRDLPVVIARRQTGATTVAGTMIVAAMAGIRVFVTGGIGGVHRGAETSMDVSADLTELARTDVAVVCAGAKAILDIGLTLEFLETHGVPVLGYRTDRFPAFYIRDGGFGVDARVDDIAELAAIIDTQRRLGLGGGTVVANPIPPEHELPADAIESAIQGALFEASRMGIAGKALTPFLLGRLAEVTGGRSLEANIALVKHNARVGAALAAALAERA